MKVSKPPVTRTEDVREVLHGVEVSDPYRWLEDVEGEEVEAWLDEQDVYSRSILDELPYREELQREFEDLFYKESISFPNPRNGRYFFVRRMADEDLGVLYVKEGLDGEPRVLVDPNELSREAGSTINLSGYSISKDAKFITYGLSEAANDQATLYVMDVDTGEKLTDEIPGELYPGTGSWSLDNSGFWYTRRMENVPSGEEKFHRKVYYHRIGSDFREDRLVFGEKLSKEDIPSAYATHDGKYLEVYASISSEGYRRREIYLVDLHAEEWELVPVVKDVKADMDVFFAMDIHREHAYILTDYEAPNGKVMRVPLTRIAEGMSAWEEVIPETEGVVESFTAVRDKLFVKTMENVHSVCREYTLRGEFVRDIPLPTLGSGGGMTAEPEGDEAFFSFTSFAFPSAVYRMDLNTGEIRLLEQVTVKTDLSSIETKQVWYTSKDGTKVPMFLIHKKGLKQTGSNPTLLYGYGGFNISLTPSFMENIFPFLERGGVYAIANLRGGGEFGEEWHKAGTKKQKQNVFDDFIAAAEWLIDNNYTSSEHLAIEGGSNGGLLVGAVMTQRPDLAKAVIMAVPVADMLRYHLFHGGRHWISDYGCAEDADMFPYLLGYSPYHNVKDGVEYPATMVVTGDKDDRVHTGQAFKMTARLQKANASDNPVLLRLERKAGHGGAADVSRYIQKAVDEWSFLFRQLGI